MSKPPERPTHSECEPTIAELKAELMQTKRQLAESAGLLNTLVENFPGGISIMDERLRLIKTNKRIRRLLDFPDWLFPEGGPLLEDLFRYNAGRGEYGSGDPEQHVAERMALARRRQPHVFERERIDGTVLEIRGIPLDNGGFVTIYLDVTERSRSQAKIAHMAHHDVLTDLPNRALLRARLEQALSEQKEGECLAILLLDLDRFKEVNDTLGHPAGDALLKAVTQRLCNCVRETDTIARLGGDEFSILHTGNVNNGTAAVLAERIQSAISSPFELAGSSVHIGTSIGIALAPEHGNDADQLMNHADVALYRAKTDGRSRYCFFKPGMDQYRKQRIEMTHDLRSALHNDEFMLHYQPLVDLSTDEICGFEALLRWTHPVHGNIPPDQFIPLAEESGLIGPIGEWVFKQACLEAATWPADLTIAVNVSPVQLRSSRFIQAIKQALRDSGIAPGRLEIEITENAIFSDKDRSFEALQEVRNLGVRIALDDFGTGYSSLSHLRKFHFDKLKIDRTFINDLSEANVDAVAVLRSLAQLGMSLGLVTTAEGVETKAQMEWVRAEGCTQMQGYYVQPPCPSAEIADLLAQFKYGKKAS